MLNYEKKYELACKRDNLVLKINYEDKHLEHMRIMAELYSQANGLYTCIYNYAESVAKFSHYNFLNLKNSLKDFLLREDKLLKIKLIIYTYPLYDVAYKNFFDSFINVGMNSIYEKPGWEGCASFVC